MSKLVFSNALRKTPHVSRESSMKGGDEVKRGETPNRKSLVATESLFTE